MTSVKAKVPDPCEVCEHEQPTQTIATKVHGTLEVCKRCADWAKAHFYVKK